MGKAELDSSVLKDAEFFEDRQVIRITFRNHSIYEYAARSDQDPPDDMAVLYLSLIHSASPGAFFAKHIKGKMPWRKVDAE